MLEAGVLQKFGELQQVVGAVVHQDHQGAHLLSIPCVENISVENISVKKRGTKTKVLILRFQKSWSDHPGEVCSPGKGNEGNSGVVVDEHLPEVFPLHIEKLAEKGVNN